MLVHIPFIGTSPVVFVKWKRCAWTYSSGGQVSCCARSTTILDLPNFSYTRQGWVFAAQKWPCPLLSMPVTTLHYTKVVLWLCCLDWVKRPHECINQKWSCQINLLLQLYCYSDQLIYMQYSDSMTCYSKVTCMQSLFCANVCWGQTGFNHNYFIHIVKCNW